MGNTGKILLIGGALWGVWQWVGKTALAAYSFTYSVASFGIVSIDNKTLRLQIGFNVVNPTMFDVLLRSLNDCVVSFNGTAIAKVDVLINRMIFKYSENLLPVIIDLNYNAAFAEIWNHILGGGRVDNWIVTVHASISADNISNIPITVNFTWSDILPNSGLNGISDAVISGTRYIKSKAQAVQFARAYASKLDKGHTPQTRPEERMHLAFKLNNWQYRPAGEYYWERWAQYNKPDFDELF